MMKPETAARKFKERNAKHLIVSAAWLDKDGRLVTQGRETWAKIRVRFRDGSQMTLWNDAHELLVKEGYRPRWLSYDSKAA